ncbi:glycosyltransferase family 2 protein [Butyrivibrio fibrisolvens]|uniref:glycosyltransferase family 2 protein n=1 Tax=Butyrivibrio fibrisolvens TaxID=831 RepID=UPI0003B697F6|nr:glycosyltransferase family 2 protein [Butyrivibrio fibrisolvens]
MSDTLFIIVPAYNESANIENFINDWYPVIEKHNPSGQSRLVIINDGSKDNTEEILKKCAANRPLLVPLTKPNGGHGDTLLFGYSYAIEHGADYIFQTDSDGQTLPSEFDSFWEDRNKFDAIFGNRTDRKDGSSRIFVEKTLCFILRIIFGIKVPDANAPFRLMKSSTVAKYINKMPQHYNLPNVMLVTYCKYYNDRITFKPITFRPRQGGVNSINIKSIVKIGQKALKDFKEMKKAM